ncbi:fimbrial assembly protein [Paraburkholderia sp. ZP32-5]|uniref:fimbrial assembly protein n=1 Tax=Paraburkholderia sp. ZP32-5 TaxID=2883245 RepID=UPI001F29B318|nr:fimbrial assembly protein [Paraburkholderia sp. ZP32-5]
MPWLGGFNLLPYRQRNARLARRRCLRDWAVAACVGATGVLALAGWQAFETARLDARRASAEQALAQLDAPLAEHTKLLRARDESRANAARATSLSEPLAHLLDLLEALSFEPGDGVVLRQLRQREYETELLATSNSDLTSAEWLERLSAVRGVKGVEVRNLQRPPVHGSAQADKAVSALVEFNARLRWGDPPSKAARVTGTAAARIAKSESSGGTK